MPAPYRVKNQYGYKITQEDAIKDFRRVHGDRFDYSEFEYLNTSTPSTIYCPKHDIKFKQSYEKHKKGQVGCNQCRSDDFYNKMVSKTPAVIEEFYQIHGDLYDYSDFTYEGSSKPSLIRCKRHDIKFYQSRDNHNKGKLGCHKCLDEYKAENSKLKWIEFCENLYGDYLDYSECDDWTSYSKPCTIRCKKHGPITVYPDYHKRYGRCKFCTFEGRSGRYSLDTLSDEELSKPATFYHIEIIPQDGSPVFEKVGITTLSLENRFRSPYFTFNVVLTANLTLRQCIEREDSVVQALEDDNLRYRSQFLRSIDIGGWTECFPKGKFSVSDHLRDHF